MVTFQESLSCNPRMLLHSLFCFTLGCLGLVFHFVPLIFCELLPVHLQAGTEVAGEVVGMGISPSKSEAID